MKRQQAFLASMVNKAVSAGTLANPVRLYKFLDAATKSLTTDPELVRRRYRRVSRQRRSLVAGAGSEHLGAEPGTAQRCGRGDHPPDRRSRHPSYRTDDKLVRRFTDRARQSSGAGRCPARCRLRGSGDLQRDQRQFGQRHHWARDGQCRGSGNTSSDLGDVFSTDASVYRLVTRTYYVAPSARKAGTSSLWSNSVPAYDGQPQPEEMVEGVEGLALLFGEDLNGVRAANRYVPAEGVRHLEQCGQRQGSDPARDGSRQRRDIAAALCFCGQHDDTA